MEQVVKNERIEMVIYKKENNLDGLDNLDQLPELPAVYALCGRINGKATNCRHVGVTENLRSAIKQHFSDNESDLCLKTFMQSIKIKSLVYETLPQGKSETLLLWKAEFKPECNEELNRVY